MSVSDILLFVGVAFAGFCFAGALAPFEALGWWAGWYRDDPETFDPPVEVEKLSDAPHFIVFLSGIHSVSGEAYAKREIAFIERLRNELPGVEVVDDVFPYSVINRSLTGQRVFARFWRWALKRKLNGPGLAGFLINLRNLWQVAVSADSRYGPIYNQGSAEIILLGLKRHGYRVGGGVPVTLIGYSGGGQIAVGAAPYLKAVLRAPLRVVSLGGVLSADPGLLELDGLYHLFGKNDGVQRLGNLFFPGRWPVLPYSPWNKAKERGTVHLVHMGDADHTGLKGYLDAESFYPDGRSYLDHTVEVISQIVRGERLEVQKSRPALQPTA